MRSAGTSATCGGGGASLVGGGEASTAEAPEDGTAVSTPGDPSAWGLGAPSTSSTLFSVFMAFNRHPWIGSAPGPRPAPHTASAALLLHHDLLPGTLRHRGRQGGGGRRPGGLG